MKNLVIFSVLAATLIGCSMDDLDPGIMNPELKSVSIELRKELGYGVVSTPTDTFRKGETLVAVIKANPSSLVDDNWYCTVEGQTANWTFSDSAVADKNLFRIKRKLDKTGIFYLDFSTSGEAGNLSAPRKTYVVIDTSKNPIITHALEIDIRQGIGPAYQTTSDFDSLKLHFRGVILPKDSVSEWRWYFGDNNSIYNGRELDYTYKAVGTYTIKLEAYSNAIKLGEVMRTIIIRNKPPVDTTCKTCNQDSVIFTKNTGYDGAIFKTKFYVSCSLIPSGDFDSKGKYEVYHNANGTYDSFNPYPCSIEGSYFVFEVTSGNLINQFDSQGKISVQNDFRFNIKRTDKTRTNGDQIWGYRNDKFSAYSDLTSPDDSNVHCQLFNRLMYKPNVKLP